MEEITFKLKQLDNYQKRFEALETELNQLKVNSSTEGEKFEKIIQKLNFDNSSERKSLSSPFSETNYDGTNITKKESVSERMSFFAMLTENESSSKKKCNCCGFSRRLSSQDDCESCRSFSILPRLKKSEHKYKNGATYVGEWRENLRDGYGVQVWPDGSRYEGEWAFDMINGKGKFTSSEGDVFEGLKKYININITLTSVLMLK